MKIRASFIALAAFSVLAVPSHAVAGGTVQVTSGNVVAARPVGPQPSLVMVRPGFVQAPLVVGQSLVVTQPLFVARQLVVTQPVVVTQPPIVIGQPFMITQPGFVQQIVLPQSGLLFTSQGATLVVR
jgi:hypothetical protein